MKSGPVALTQTRRARLVRSDAVQRLLAFAALIVIIVVFSLASPNFLQFDNVVGILLATTVNGILALGVTFEIITAGIDLSIGSVVGLTIVILTLMMRAGVPALPACLVVLAAGTAIGLVNGLLLTRLRLPHPFISTLGTLNVARGAALLLTNGVPISGLPPGFREATAGSVLGVPMPVVIAAGAYVATHVFLSRTVYNREAARLCGIPVDRRLNLAYALSGAAAALAAIVLAARMNSGFPLAGTGAELDAIAAVIIGGASFFGGVGTVSGTLIGALIIGFLRNGLNLLDVSAFWQMIVIGVVIVVAVWIDVLRQRVGRAA